MSKRVVGNVSEWPGIFKKFFQQIQDGSITRKMLQDFLEHNNPFAIVESVTQTFGDFSDWSGSLKDFARQFSDSSLGLQELQDLVNGVNPFKIFEP